VINKKKKKKNSQTYGTEKGGKTKSQRRISAWTNRRHHHCPGHHFLLCGIRDDCQHPGHALPLVCKVSQRAGQGADEVREIMARHDGEINHETIEKMEYLEATINENLRMNSPALLHFRDCSKDTEVCSLMFSNPHYCTVLS
jgi:hypothetical protein